MIKLSKVKSMALMAGMLLAIAGVQAQEQDAEPLVTDRPDFTESTETVARGRVQVETGATVERAEEERAFGLDETLVRIGVSERSEVRIGLPGYGRVRASDEGNSGFEDAFLGGKWVLQKGAEGRPAIAVIAGSTLPTGSRRSAERKYQPEVVLAASYDLSEKWAIASNVGAARASAEGERFTQIFGSVSLARSINRRWGTYFEVFAFNRGEPGGDSQQYFNTGVTYLINNDLQLDARIGRGFNGEREYFYGAGVSTRF